MKKAIMRIILVILFIVGVQKIFEAQTTLTYNDEGELFLTLDSRNICEKHIGFRVDGVSGCASLDRKLQPIYFQRGPDLSKQSIRVFTAIPNSKISDRDKTYTAPYERRVKLLWIDEETQTLIRVDYSSYQALEKRYQDVPKGQYLVHWNPLSYSPAGYDSALNPFYQETISKKQP